MKFKNEPQKIKVLHVLSSLNASGGIVHVVKNFLENIDQQEVEFGMAYFLETPSNLKEYFCDKNVKLYKFDKLNLKNFFKVRKQFVDILIQYECDIIHLHMPILHFVVKSAIQIVEKSTNRKIKLIQHAHDNRLSSSALRRVRSRLMLLGVQKKTDKLLACSKDAGKNFFGNHFTKNGCVLYNAINLDKFCSTKQHVGKLKKEFGINDDIVYCHVGRLCQQKNQEFVIDIFNEIVKCQPQSKLLLVGLGDESRVSFLNDKIKAFGLNDKVLLLGSRTDVQDILNLSDVFIFPSRHEGLGIVLIEAQVSKVRCFASDRCPEESKISNLIQYLSLKQTAKEWADIIINSEYPTNVEIDTQNYDIKVVAKQLVNIYKELVN